MSEFKIWFWKHWPHEHNRDVVNYYQYENPTAWSEVRLCSKCMRYMGGRRQYTIPAGLP